MMLSVVMGPGSGQHSLLIKKAAGMQIWFIRSATDAHIGYKCSSLSKIITVPLWQGGSPYMIL